MVLLSIVLLLSMSVIDITADVIHRTKDNELGMRGPIVIAYYKFESKTTSKMNNYWKNRMKAVSDQHKDVKFAVSDSDQFLNKLEDYGLEFDWKQWLESQPLVIAEDANQVRYVFDQKLTTDSLEKFVHQFKSRELTPHVKSEPIPDNEGKAVKDVVGKTFKELVIDNKKHVFMLLYAHWCGHCKQVLPVWQRLGKRLADTSDVDIVQMDLTKNDAPKPYNIMRYPTIYWLASNDKQSPQQYSDERTVKEFMKYITQMSAKARKESQPKSDKTEL